MKRVARTSGTDIQVSQWRTAFSTAAARTSRRGSAGSPGRAVSAKPITRAPSPFLRPRTGRILLVNADTYERLELEAMLLAHGYIVLSESSFDQAGKLMRTIPVDLLITSVQLAAFNGLHLAIRSRRYDPRRAVIITHDSFDATVKEEAESLGAVYVVDPAENPEFLPSVAQALHGSRYTKLMA